MTDAADVLDVRDVGLAAPPRTDGPATDILGADITTDVPADARSQSPRSSQSPESPESRQLLRDLVLRALL
jgi:hypothetical protein